MKPEEIGRNRIDPERALVLHYADPAASNALEALFGLDDSLAGILRTTREPMVGQMRLTWWHEALSRLDTDEPPAEPVLQALARHVVGRGVTGARLAGLVEGWEELLEPGHLVDDAITRHAALRGGSLFELAGALVGAAPSDPLRAAGEGWAMADLARHLSDRLAAERVAAQAAAPLAIATRSRWSRPARPLGALAHLARMNLDVPLDRPLPAGAPGRVARLAWHRLTGR
jgi:phytoene synthase